MNQMIFFIEFLAQWPMSRLEAIKTIAVRPSHANKRKVWVSLKPSTSTSTSIVVS
jgi:hypothetical protein